MEQAQRDWGHVQVEAGGFALREPEPYPVQTRAAAQAGVCGRSAAVEAGCSAAGAGSGPESAAFGLQGQT